MFKRFDKWAQSGPFTVVDVSAYRIIFGLSALVLMPNAQFLAEYPDSFFSPPPGPFRLVPALPPLGALVGLEIALALALAAVVFGVFTRTASILAGLLLIAVYGLSYSFGKIDHTIFLPLVALLVVWAGWGGRFSIDSASQVPTSSAPRQWPLRLLALLIGVGFATAAVPKVLSGWLNPGTQATEGHYWYELLIDGRDAAFAPLFGQITSPAFWEPLDWITIVLEAGLIVSVLNWRAFRIMISFAMIFHVGVMIMMNILFTSNVVAYGAFVSWGVALEWLRARGVQAPRLTVAHWRVAAAIGVPALGIGAWALSSTISTDGENGLRLIVVITGGLIGAGYLVYEIWKLVSFIRARGLKARVSGTRRRSN